jgi:ESX secretion system protein EccE
MKLHCGLTLCGRVVLAQLALGALAAAAAAGTPGAWALGAPAAGAALGLGLGSARGRPLYVWCGIAVRRALRVRRLPPGADGAALLALLVPAAPGHGPLDQPGTGSDPCHDGGDPWGAADAGLVEDAHGLTAVLELGDADPVSGDPMRLPAVCGLVPPPAPGTPSIRVQVLVCGIPAPASGAAAGVAATSYRQLTEGRVPGHRRILLAVRACRDDPLWTAGELRPALLSAARHIAGRCAGGRGAARFLDRPGLSRTLVELAHHDPAQPLWEGWAGLHAGGLHQATVLLRGAGAATARAQRHRRWPGPAEPESHLVARLLCLPAAAVTVSLTAGREGSQVVLRYAAASPAGLAVAGTVLDRLLADLGHSAVGLVGEQLDGLAATLPLARLRWPARRAGSPPAGAGTPGPDTAVPGKADPHPTNAEPGGTDPGKTDPGRTDARETEPSRTDPGKTDPGRTDPDHPAPQFFRSGAACPTEVPAAGLVLGRDRQGRPVTARLTRPEPTRAVLLGGVGTAAVLALRALALGTSVTVQTGRPGTWAEVLRTVLPAGQMVPMIPPGQPVAAATASPLAPRLLVVDATAPAGEPPVAAAPWHATLLVRDRLTAADTAALTRADIVIMQPLPAAEAALAGTALGLDGAALGPDRAARELDGGRGRPGPPRPGALAVASPGRLIWAQLSATPVELPVIAAPDQATAAAATPG